MQYQRLDPQPIVYWHERSQMYASGDQTQLRVLAFLEGYEPVLAPRQKAPWPGATLWHDRDGEWYWRRAFPKPICFWSDGDVHCGAAYTRCVIELTPGEPLTIDWPDSPPIQLL